MLSCLEKVVVRAMLDTPIYDEVAPDFSGDYLDPRQLPYNFYENLEAVYSTIDYSDSDDSSFSWGSSGS